MTVVSMSYLLEAGVHFGHQTRRWNPKMKEYIFTSRDDIYIIDLQKTAKKIEEAYAALKEIAELRLKNPNASLIELGKMLKQPIGKSGVNYRLKKIMEIANEK